jgi:hypothetical protein
MERFVRFRDISLTACVLRTDSVTWCDRAVDDESRTVVFGIFPVCPICLMGAAAEGVDLPRSTGVGA